MVGSMDKKWKNMEWIPIYKFKIIGKRKVERWFCSSCNHVVGKGFEITKRTPYCPYCGGKSDLK